MTEQEPRHTEALNMRVSRTVRNRLDAQAGRYDQTITAVSRMALLIGLEALERLQVNIPDAPALPHTASGADGGPG